jgi:hypothetical protein
MKNGLVAFGAGPSREVRLQAWTVAFKGIIGYIFPISWVLEWNSRPESCKRGSLSPKRVSGGQVKSSVSDALSRQAEKKGKQSRALLLAVLVIFGSCLVLASCRSSNSSEAVGFNPAVTISPSSFTFVGQQVGTTSSPESVSLSNTGNATLNLSNIAVSGDFAESNTCGNSLSAGASCTFSVTFTPAAAGLRTGTVTVTDNADGSPQTISLSGTCTSPASTGNTPLVDLATNQKYLGAFPGLLYTDPVTHVNVNTVPTQHDIDGRAIALQVQPLDANGDPSSSGKIGVIGIGMSNWTQELCANSPTSSSCLSYTFLGQAATNSQVNHTILALVDCAQDAQTAIDWIDNSVGSYSTCVNDRLPLWGITAKQVEIVLWKDADGGPTNSLTSSTVCLSQPLPIPSSNPDACTYEEYLGLMARFLKSEFPNVKQLFVHSRIYAGYATTPQNPEPFAYEYGFATKWFVNAQLAQIATGNIDPVAGDLDYKDGTVPWIAWGPYWWAAGTTPCNNCEIPGQIWVSSDLSADGTHPSANGVTKVANNLMHFYLNSPYSPWFRAP